MKFIIPAIVTLIISITSGLLLDYYKNLAPKILGNVRKSKPIEANSKKKCSYIITVSNPSNKTIHELTLNIQSSQTNLNSTGAKITKGLKFDSSIEDNILEVYIPFLSKGDKFSVIVHVENEDEVHNKPVLVIRSPEKFNQIDSVEQKGRQSLLFNIPKNINKVILKAMQKVKPIVPNIKDDFTTVMSKATSAEQTTNKKDRQVLPGNKKLSKSKKVMIITVSIILVMVTGVLKKIYFTGTPTKAKTPTVKTIVPKQSTGETESVGGTTGVNGKTGSRTENTDATKSTTGNTGSTKSPGRTTETKGTGSTTETNGTGGTTETKGTGGTTETKGAGGTTKTKEAGGTTETKGAGGTTETKGAEGTTETKEAGGITETKEAGGTTETKGTGGTTETTGTGGTTETKEAGATTGTAGN